MLDTPRVGLPTTGSQNFTRVSRKNLCPHCGHDSGCKIFDDDKVWCLRISSESEVQPGFRFLGWLKNHMGASVAPSGNLSFTAKTNYQDQHQRRHSNKTKALLPTTDRDYQLRALASSAGLCSSHRQHLTRVRGLTEPEVEFAIASKWLWSWYGKSPAPALASLELPGIDRYGRLNNYEGFAIAALNPQGQLTGCQIKTDSGEPKYHWASSNKVGGNGPQLPNGELPLFVWRHPNSSKVKEVYLCEGALKSLLVAMHLWRQQRYDIAVIGTASAAHYGKQTLRQYLQELGAKKVRILPDAGAVLNSHIWKAIGQTINWCRASKYEVRIGWWGQVSKNEPDIDELENWDRVSFVSVADFYHIKALVDGEYLNIVQKRLSALRQKFTFSSAKGFEKEEISAPQSLAKELTTYPASSRLDTWSQIEANFLLDTSGTGTGKSWDSGMATPELFDSERVIYLSSEHRNPTTKTLKAWPDLEARHMGLFRDEYDKLRRVKPGQPYLIAPNCGRSELIQILRAKNITDADTAGLICSTCPYLEPCRAGAIFGYLSDRADTLKQPRFRAHPQSLPDPLEFDYSNTVLLWDEATAILKGHLTVEVTVEALDKTLVQIALKLPDLMATLSPILLALRNFLATGEVPKKKYGWSDEELRSSLPNVELSDSHLEELQTALTPNLDFLNSTKEYEVDLADLPLRLRKAFSPALPKEAISLETDWLIDFLEIISNRITGSLHIQNQILSITLPDSRMSRIARAAKKNIFIDATADSEELAAVLGVDKSSIVQIEADAPQADNLKVIQIATLGRLSTGSVRSEFCQKRLNALLNKIQELHSNTSISIIDFKRHAKPSEAKFHWWAHSRGLNDMEKSQVLVLVGVPCRNLHDLEAEFTVLYNRRPEKGTTQKRYLLAPGSQVEGDLFPYFDQTTSSDRQFCDFVRRRILADIHQAIGRLRALRRLNEQLCVYFIADFPIDIPVTVQPASNLTIEAATKTEIAEKAITLAVKQLLIAGEKVTQQAIAAITGYSQQHISRFKSLLISLLGNNNRKMSENFPQSPSDPPAPDDIVWASEIFFPAVAKSDLSQTISDLVTIFDIFGEKWGRKAWEMTSAIAQVEILQKILLLHYSS